MKMYQYIKYLEIDEVVCLLFRISSNSFNFYLLLC